MAELKFGKIIFMHEDKNILERKFRFAHELGMTTVQLQTFYKETRTDEMADFVLELCEKYGIEISTLWIFCGPYLNDSWNAYLGPEVLGLVPVTYRANRLAEMVEAIPFAKKVGAPSMTTHVGYLPERPRDPNYIGTVVALKVLCEALKNNGMGFNFETGQETPATLLRTIEDIGVDNVGINLDPANLITDGKANPCDAMDTFGRYVRGIHVKDGLYPTNPRDDGDETRAGEGKVDFPRLVKLLNEYKYSGPFTIEREIPESAAQTADILGAMEIIRSEYNKYSWDF